MLRAGALLGFAAWLCESPVGAQAGSSADAGVPPVSADAAVPAQPSADAGVPALSDASAPDASADASAPDAAPPPSAAAATGLVPPRLIEASDAKYPEGSEPSGPVSVLLRLTIDVEGHVTDAEVVESAGEAFDAAAREAALRYRFAPATRDGVPLTARIQLRVQFTPPAPPAAPPPPEPLAPPPAPAAPKAPSSEARVQEVHVEGQQRENERMTQSAEAVLVKDMERARRESSTMGEVLARLPGVEIRRAGGLGSQERISLNGISDDRVATFIDGVPLEFAFFPFGLSVFPVSLSDRVEIYKGVVPLRFGADALGGAINIVTDRRYENSVTGSLELGSFGTQRLTAGGSYRHEATGLVANGMAYYDHADNDYKIDVNVPDERGRLVPAHVRRFHDGYRSYGGTVEVGVVDKPWARRLLLRGYAVTLEKELQNNLVMSVPYGEAHYGQGAVGATARYEVDVTRDFKLEALAGYSHRTSTFVDTSMWVYNWFGQRVKERRIPGEVENNPTDQVFWWHNVLGRVVGTYQLLPTQVITFASTPTFVKLTGDERVQADPTARDPLNALRERTTAISGVEYEANFFLMPDARSARNAEEERAKSEEADYRLQNILFFKHYLYHVASQEVVPGGAVRDRNVDSNTFGVGDGLRFRFLRELLLKASYEFATQLPRPDQVFGDGILVHANLTIRPELSHNVNLGPQLDLKRTRLGDFHVETTGFLRAADRQMVLLGNDRYLTWQNVYSARSLGAEALVSWSSPKRYLMLDLTGTYQDFRNTSDEGTFRDFNGDRIPNRPWLFGSWTARGHFERVLARDELEPFYIGRYVGDFFRGWESQGLREFKQRIPSQLSHTIGITYVLKSDFGTYTATFEIQNLTDAKLYDFWGVQRPGRGVAFKLTGDFR